MNPPTTRYRVVYAAMTIVATWGVLWFVITILQENVTAQTNSDDFLPSSSQSMTHATNLERTFEPSLTLAAYQAWFGLNSHIQPPPYVSTDTTVISGHIAAAMSQGIDGFVVDWYGPEAGVVNDVDRKFIDQATTELLRQSNDEEFRIALMYDEGTVVATEAFTTAYTNRVISDLLYARQYLTMSAYLTISGHPAIFVFPYSTVDPYVDWAEVRRQLGITVTLIDKDPDPLDSAHDALFDGFYAWVQAQWETDGTEWGEEYLTWFYPTMSTTAYANNITIGGVWPGFDDTLASWGSGRYIWRRCGQTWRDTRRIAAQYKPQYVLIATWNDFEEGTDIERGIGECLTPDRMKCTPLSGGAVVYTHTLANTGKFTDTFNLQAHSSNAWPIVMGTTSITLVGHASTTLAITMTVPETTRVGVRDTMVVTATSALSTAVNSSVVNTTTACGCFLPIILRDYTVRSISVSGPAEVHSRITDVHGVWTGFPAVEVTVRLYAQEGNNYWCVQPSRAATVYSDHWTAEGQFGGVATYGVFAVAVSGDGNQLPGCAAAPGWNYVTAANEEQFRNHIHPYVYLGDGRAISPRFVISRVE